MVLAILKGEGATRDNARSNFFHFHAVFVKNLANPDPLLITTTLQRLSAVLVDLPRYL